MTTEEPVTEDDDDKLTPAAELEAVAAEADTDHDGEPTLTSDLDDEEPEGTAAEPLSAEADPPDEPGWAHSVLDAQIVEAASMSNEPAAPAGVVKIRCWAYQGAARNSPPCA